MTNDIKIGDIVKRTDRDDYIEKDFVVVSETPKRFGVHMLLKDGRIWEKTTYVAKHNVTKAVA